MVEGAIPGGHKAHHRRAQAIFQRRLRIAQGLPQFRLAQRRQQLMAMRMRSDFVAGGMDLADLGRIVQRQIARLGRLAHTGKGGDDAMPGQQRQNAVGAGVLQHRVRRPAVVANGKTGGRVVIPDEHEGQGHGRDSDGMVRR